MFDSNPKTCWHSGKNRKIELKIIGIHFKVSACKSLSLDCDVKASKYVSYSESQRIYFKTPIEFVSLTILKRTTCCGNRYNKVCLILDGDVANEICTNSDTGFNNQTSDWITWELNASGK